MKNSVVSLVLRLSLTLLIVTAVMAAALAGVNKLTENRIAALNAEKKEQAIREVMRWKNLEVSEIEFTDDTGLVKKVYRTERYYYGCEHPPAGDFYGYDYVVEVEPKGFDGPLTMMVGIDREGKIMGISVVSHTETAGLGAVAAADNDAGKTFRGQFIHRSEAVAVTKDGGNVDAITGATITSRAICAGINAALACVKEVQA
jgi:electron transport complex protein RnfG